jgi:site-specific DNA recombinase
MRSATVVSLIYTRVSTDEQANEGYSLDAQLAEARRYAARNEWIIGAEFQDVLSGKRDDRPQYQALLAEVRRIRAEGRPAAVVVAALDRFGRSILERIRSREELKRAGVATHSVREGGEVSDLVANILAATAQEESRRLGERVLASRDHLASQGWKPSGRAPWGYAWRPATDDERRQGAPASVLEPDPITSPFVREAFERAATSQSVRGVSRWVASLPPAARGDRNLRYCALRDTLSAAVYVGRIDDRDEPDVFARARGRWLPLIDDDVFSAVQDRIAGHLKMPRQASKRFLLTGLIRCQCGSRMVGMATTGRSVRYRCIGHMSGANSASLRCQSSVHAGQLEEGVIEKVVAYVEQLASTDATIRAAARRAWDALGRSPDAQADNRQRQGLEREAARARKRLADAARLLVDGTLDKAGYEALRDEERARLDAAEQGLTNFGHTVRGTSATLPSLETVLRLARGWPEIIVAGSIPAKRDLLGLLVASVTPERVGWGKYAPVIKWTTLGMAVKDVAEQVGPSRNDREMVVAR